MESEREKIAKLWFYYGMSEQEKLSHLILTRKLNEWKGVIHPHQYCLAVIDILRKVPSYLYGELFVEFRMEFCRLFTAKLIMSTSHGSEFFQNVVNCLEGKEEWTEAGEYGDNFRKMIELYRKPKE